MPQANAGVGGGETPLHFGPFAISGLSPGQQLGVELFWPIDPSIQTLPRQHAELNLGNVQPASMLGRMDQFELMRNPQSFGWLKRLIERAQLVRVEIVTHERDPLGVPGRRNL